jgi:plasmid stability protein
MSQIIELPDESVALLRRQASAHGLSVEAWVEALAHEKAQESNLEPVPQKAQAAVARILEIQKRTKPDPEGWTIRHYINHGRR